MWHPFNLIPEMLSIGPELRYAQPGPNRTVKYKERSLTYFKDKSSESEQWPVNMEELPGVTITRRGEQELTLNVTHTWKVDYVRTLSGEMKCAGPWHSPSSWSFQREFKPLVRGAKPFAPVSVAGSWTGGALRQTHRGSVHQQVDSQDTAFLLSTYALMSGFPAESAPPQKGAALLGEDLTIAGAARVGRCAEVLHEHPLAKDLTGRQVEVQGDFPTEFWVNPSGIVVYVFNGVGKAFILSETTAVL